MAVNQAPEEPGILDRFVGANGQLDMHALDMLVSMWRQICAGFVVVPCSAAFASNVYTLTPLLHPEGAQSYGFGMVWAFESPATATGDVTIGVGELDVVKGYVDDGAAQATTGDLVEDSLFLAIYTPNLDSGNGGIVCK